MSEETFNYFVYGSSLDFAAFEGWCKQHSHEMPNLNNYELAKLFNYAITLNISSKFWGGGVASIKEEQGSVVEGISIKLSNDLLTLIRQKEGVPNNLYYEEKVKIQTNSGEEKEAVVYIGSPSKVDETVKPSERYTRALIEGAKARGLSPQWIDKLQQLLPNSDHAVVDNNNNNNDNIVIQPKEGLTNKLVVTEEQLKSTLSAAIPSIFLKVHDESSGCGSKFSVIIVSEKFEGITLVNRHRLVNDAVKELMPHIHALSLKTWTPTQYQTKLDAGETF